MKYEGIRESNPDTAFRLEKAQKEAEQDIEEIRSIMGKYGLYHRSKTDGAVVVRTEEGWLVSQTKTDKTSLRPEEFSLVLSADKDANKIRFEGSKLPSSDCPELVEALGMLESSEKEVLAIHFHHNETTRGTRFLSHTTRKALEYGRFESGAKIVQEFGRMNSNWIILREHGILWVGKSPEEFEKFVSETLGINAIQQQG